MSKFIWVQHIAFALQHGCPRGRQRIEAEGFSVSPVNHGIFKFIYFSTQMAIALWPPMLAPPNR